MPVLLSRCAMKDYEFSNGMTIPAGTHVAVSTHRPHFDDQIYGDPKHFDGFRFYKLRQASKSKGEPGRKFDMTWTSADALHFGAGKHACPGRFFAACELKLMFAHLITNYDMKLAKEGVRPADQWLSILCMPNTSAKVLFRKRRCQPPT